MPDKILAGPNSIVESQLPSYLRSRNRNYKVSQSTTNSESQKFTFEVIAGSNLQQGDPVYISSDGKAYLADNRECQFICLSLTSAGYLTKLSNSGELIINGKNFTIGGEIYLGANGTLTQVHPTANYLQELGYALTADKMFIQIGLFYEFE
jgi:hypothetical protein